jgi:hypothetical protein
LPLGETTTPPRAELNIRGAGCKASVFRDMHVEYAEALVLLVEGPVEARRKHARGFQKGIKYMASGCAGCTDPSQGGLIIGVPSIKRAKRPVRPTPGKESEAMPIRENTVD